MGAGPPVIERVTVEIHYGDGRTGLFYDRAETVRRSLLDQLGTPPFTAGHPVALMTPALASPAERLTLRYDHQHLVVAQESVETIARVEEVAPVAWAEVDEQLGLQHRVRRAGIRFLFMWPAQSAADAEAKLQSLGLFQEQPRVREVFGEAPRRRSYTVVVGTEERPIRYHLAGASAVVENGGGDPAESLKKFQIPWGILLDVDCARVSTVSAPARINQADFRSFIRASWSRSIVTARALSELL